MITATQAVEISNTNADQIEKDLDQKSVFWKKVKDRLKQEGFRIDNYKNEYTVQNGFGAKWEDYSYGFTIYWG